MTIVRLYVYFEFKKNLKYESYNVFLFFFTQQKLAFLNASLTPHC